MRLALEEAGAAYVDVARSDEDGEGVEALMGLMPGDLERPSFLKAGPHVIGQTANILLFLGDKHGLARIPKYLDHFELVLARNPSGADHLVGAELSYAGLSLFQVLAGLGYAFPKAMAALKPNYPLRHALHDAVSRRPRIAAYLASDRRIPFNEDGIFRHYPKQDG